MRTEVNPGEVKKIITIGLIILFFFNIPYKLDVAQSKITAFFDSFINSVMFSYIFGLTLVLSHSLTASLYISRRQFFLPKIVICVPLMLTMWVWLYADQLTHLAYYRNSFQPEPKSVKFSKRSFIAMLIPLSVVFLSNIFYSYKALTVNSNSHN